MTESDASACSWLALKGVLCNNHGLMAKDLAPIVQEIRKWRAKNNLSQAQAVKVFNPGGLQVTLDSLQNWEIGRYTPSPLATTALMQFLNSHSKVTPPKIGREKKR